MGGVVESVFVAVFNSTGRCIYVCWCVGKEGEGGGGGGDAAAGDWGICDVTVVTGSGAIGLVEGRGRGNMHGAATY